MAMLPIHFTDRTFFFRTTIFWLQFNIALEFLVFWILAPANTLEIWDWKTNNWLSNECTKILKHFLGIKMKFYYLAKVQVGFHWPSKKVIYRESVVAFVGGASVHFHVINKESRKFFNRAYSTSGTALSFFALHRTNHLDRVQKCFQTNESDQLVAYLKVADRSILVKCHPFIIPDDLYPVWVPTIENANVNGAFITKTPDDIYQSNLASKIDAVFGFTSQVINSIILKRPIFMVFIWCLFD